MKLERARLGVNIDHVATIRNARGGAHPDPAKAAAIAEAAGADGITIHLREDRRHIRDHDLEAVRKAVKLPINLEMAATDEMLAIALAFKPHAACIVPERREERTTEGGLDVARLHNQVAPFVSKLRDAKVRVSLFIEPSKVQVAVAEAIGAPVVELHTGKYVELVFAGDKAGATEELKRLQEAAAYGAEKGIEIHAGHGVGLGQDMCDIRRIEKSLERFGDRFTHRVFTEVERRTADRRKQRAATYAKRFAAKEACAKALGTGVPRRGVHWQHMGVVNLPSGKPTFALTGGAAERLAKLTPPGMTCFIHLTITDEYPYAQAQVIIEALPTGTVSP
jgi:pyridoxine 5-phosphate synthase